MVAAMVEMVVKAPTPPPRQGLGDHTIGGGEIETWGIAPTQWTC